MKHYLVNAITLLAGRRSIMGVNSVFRLRESEGSLVQEGLRYVQNLVPFFNHLIN